MPWMARTATDTAVDTAYFPEADHMVTLLATGTVEPEATARAQVEAWFRERFNLGTSTCGADYWTFLLARAAAQFRLEHMEARLKEIYARDRLAASLGLRPNVGIPGPPLRTDETCDVCRGFAAWLGTKRGGPEVALDDDDDAAYAHLKVMLGTSLRKAFERKVAELFEARATHEPVASAATLLDEAARDGADARAPRTALATNVLRCSAVAATVDDLAFDLDAVRSTFEVLRVRNDFADSKDGRAARADAYGDASITLTVLFEHPTKSIADLHGAAGRLWNAYIEHQPVTDHALAHLAKDYLCDVADHTAKIAFVAEIALKYEPFDTEVAKAKIHYAFMQAQDPDALLRAFRGDSPCADSDLHNSYRAELEKYNFDEAL